MKPKKGKKADKASPYGKLIKDDKNNRFYKMVNTGYTLTMIVFNFSKKIVWFGSVFAFMYMFPVSFEMFQEQQKILMKMQMSQMMEGMGDSAGAGGAPIVRPF